jgi:hypothetical protein
VLHFDVNETIMVGDPAGGDTFDESLNKIVCKSAFCRTGDGETWHDGAAVVAGEAAVGTPIPPLHTAWEWPEGCAPIYRTLKERDDKVRWCLQMGTLNIPCSNAPLHQWSIAHQSRSERGHQGLLVAARVAARPRPLFLPSMRTVS